MGLIPEEDQMKSVQASRPMMSNTEALKAAVEEIKKLRRDLELSNAKLYGFEGMLSAIHADSRLKLEHRQQGAQEDILHELKSHIRANDVAERMKPQLSDMPSAKSPHP